MGAAKATHGRRSAFTRSLANFLPRTLFHLTTLPTLWIQSVGRLPRTTTGPFYPTNQTAGHRVCSHATELEVNPIARQARQNLRETFDRVSLLHAVNTPNLANLQISRTANIHTSRPAPAQHVGNTKHNSRSAQSRDLLHSLPKDKLQLPRPLRLGQLHQLALPPPDPFLHGTRRLALDRQHKRLPIHLRRHIRRRDQILVTTQCTGHAEYGEQRTRYERQPVLRNI